MECRFKVATPFEAFLIAYSMYVFLPHSFQLTWKIFALNFSVLTSCIDYSLIFFLVHQDCFYKFVSCFHTSLSNLTPTKNMNNISVNTKDRTKCRKLTFKLFIFFFIWNWCIISLSYIIKKIADKMKINLLSITYFIFY